MIPWALGEALGRMVFNAGTLLWLLIPFYDGFANTGRRGRRAHYFGVGTLAAVAITAIGAYWCVR